MPPFNYPGTSEFSHQFAAFAGLQSRGGAYTSLDSSSLSDGTVNVEVEGESDAEDFITPEQLAALQYLTDHPDQIRAALFAALADEYPKLKEMYGLDPDDPEMLEWFPEVREPKDFARVFGVGNLFVLDERYEGVAYLGLECGCTWDDEHGLGIVLHRDRVIEVGQADIAFSSWPARRDLEQLSGVGEGQPSIVAMEENVENLTEFLQDAAALQSAAREKLEEVKRGKRWWEFWK